MLYSPKGFTNGCREERSRRRRTSGGGDEAG
jgi:hypothetical protein